MCTVFRSSVVGGVSTVFEFLLLFAIKKQSEARKNKRHNRNIETMLVFLSIYCLRLKCIRFSCVCVCVCWKFSLPFPGRSAAKERTTVQTPVVSSIYSVRCVGRWCCLFVCFPPARRPVCSSAGSSRMLDTSWHGILGAWHSFGTLLLV